MMPPEYLTVRSGCQGKTEKSMLIQKVHSANMTECTAACNQLHTCGAVAFHSKTSMCWLKRRCERIGMFGRCNVGAGDAPCVATKGPAVVTATQATTLLPAAAADMASRVRRYYAAHGGPNSEFRAADIYRSMQGFCSSSKDDMTEKFPVVSLLDCQARCDTVFQGRCRAVVYRRNTKTCLLKRGCDADATAGLCPTGKNWCVYARDLRTRALTDNQVRSLKRAQRLLDARRTAQVEANLTQRALASGGVSVCSSARFNLSAGVELGPTVGKWWRYYTAFSCGDSASPRTCLSFKNGTYGSSIHALSSSLAAGEQEEDAFTSERPLLEFPAALQWYFAHNAALLRLSRTEYVMLGGMQRFGAHYIEDSSSGIRLSHGVGWPWENVSWSAPQVVLHGATPAGCIDRRPQRTGYPTRVACEFDARLSLVRFREDFWLYARANLRVNAIVGGRWVQVTRSRQLEAGSWAAWSLVSVLGVDPDQLDLYFFAAQQNPADPTSLLALFPASQPPSSCIAVAFSRNGFNFSRPVSLLAGRVVYRIERQYGRKDSVSARSADHPVAGAVLHGSDVHFYVHHAPVGISGTRWGSKRGTGVSRVVRYQMSLDELAALTRKSLAEL